MDLTLMHGRPISVSRPIVSPPPGLALVMAAGRHVGRDAVGGYVSHRPFGLNVFTRGSDDDGQFGLPVGPGAAGIVVRARFERLA